MKAPAKTRLAKIGRPKRDFLNGGMAEDSGFWQPALDRIGKRMVKGGYMTADEWCEFSGRNGAWSTLKAIACNPATLLLGADNPMSAPRVCSPAERLKNSDGWRTWLCEQIVKRPVAVPLFLAWIREEVAGTNEVERWLAYGFFGRRRAAFSDGELATMYNEETKRRCTVEMMTQARENITRRVRR